MTKACLLKNSIETIDLETSVVTATGFKQDIKQAPSSISIVAGKSLQSRPVRDLGEAVVDVPGVSIDTGASNFGGYDIALRGMPRRYTLMLLDGKRQDSSPETIDGLIFSNAAFIPPISAIERIEVVRGPASTIYGTDAIGGVVNVIMKKSFSKWSGNVMMSSTLQEQANFSHSINTSLFAGGPLDKEKKLSLQIRASDTQSFSPKSFTVSVPTVAGGSKDITVTSIGEENRIIGSGKNNQWNVGLRLGYAPSASNYFYIDIGHSGKYYGDSRVNGNLIYQGKFFTRNNSIFRHEGRYGEYGEIKTDTSIQYNNMLSEYYNLSGTDTYNRFGNDIILEHRTSFPVWNMNFNIGAQYIYNRVNALNGQVFGNIADNKAMDRHNYALYAEDEWFIIDPLILTLGVRVNMSNNFGIHASPRAYLVYHALENSAIGDLSIKSGVSTGYKIPSIRDMQSGFIHILNFENPTSETRLYGNPNLKPESSLTYELGFIHDTSAHNFSITGFYTRFYDKILEMSEISTGASMPAGYTCQYPICRTLTNATQAQSYGIELGFGIKPVQVGIGELDMNLSYTWQKSEILSGSDKGKPNSNSPEHTLNTSINYNYKNLGLYMRGEYRAKHLRSEVDRVGGVSGADPELPNLIYRNLMSAYYKPYFLLHIGANYRITKNLMAHFGIYNLLNENFLEYYAYTRTFAGESGSVTEDRATRNYHSAYEGRRYYISLSYDF